MAAASRLIKYFSTRTLFLSACSVLAAFAQLYTGSLTGTVLDPSGKAVPNARITLHDIDHNTATLAQTDHLGRYVFGSVAPGAYSVLVEAVGFEPYEIPDIAIDVNASSSADAHLRIAGRRETMTIQSDSSAARVENATIGLVLGRSVISDLPLIDRNPFDLAFLSPGVSQAPGTTYGNGVGSPGFVTNFVSDGSRNAQGDLLLDGTSITNSDNNPGVQKALYVPPVEAIQEFKIQQSNFSAEFGNSGGTIINGHTLRWQSISRRVIRIFQK